MYFTIFTPTYNRAYIISKLYNSLLDQTFTDFEWIIVDDGSTDKTQELVESFINQKKINIRYIFQKNGGKHRAINRGTIEAKGELFFIVDSDDSLNKDALSIMYKEYISIKDNDDIAGVVGLRYHYDGQIIGTTLDKENVICSNFDYRYKYKIKGDKAEIIKTKILRNYPFPEIDGENFISESIVWNKIASDYKYLFTNKKIYIGDYLTDGLTAKSLSLRMNNPRGSCLLYSQLSKFNIPYIYKLRATINYWRYARLIDKDISKKIKDIGWAKSILVFPIVLSIFIKDYFQNKKQVK